MPAPARFSLGAKPTRGELIGIGAVLVVYGAVALSLIAQGAPLGHDEAVYAVKSRQMRQGGTSLWYWNDYRAPGLPLFLQVTWLIRGTEPYLRATVAAFGALGVVATWLIGRYLFDQVSGVAGAAGLALASPWLASSTSLWPDVPAAVLGLMGIGIVIFATNGDRASWWIVVAAPLAVAATLVRFGAPIPMGVGVLAVMAWRWRVVTRSVPQFLTVALLSVGPSAAVLFVPEVVGARIAPFVANQSLVGGRVSPVVDALKDYVKQAELIVGGYVGLFFILGFVFAGLYAIRDRLNIRTWSVTVGAGLGTIVALSLVLHGEYRYLAPAYPLLWMVAGWGLVETYRRVRSNEAMKVALVVLALALPWNAASHSRFEVELLAGRFDELRAVSRTIDRAHGYEDCGVITSYIPQVAWYAECVTRRFEDVPVLESPFFPRPIADYVLFLADGKRQPVGPQREAYLALTDGVFEEAGIREAGRYEYAVVYDVAASAAD